MSTEERDVEMVVASDDVINLGTAGSNESNINLSPKQTQSHLGGISSPFADVKHWAEARPTASHLRERNTCQSTSVFSIFLREFYFPRNHADEFEKIFFAWVLVTFLACGVSVFALIIDYGVYLVRFAVYGMSQTLILDGAHGDPSGSDLSVAFVLFAITSAFFALCASVLVLYVSILGQSSGLPETKSYLNGVHLVGLFSAHTLLSKLLGTAFSIGCGLIAGKEGPIIHIGAILGSAISQGSSRFFQIRAPDTIAKHFRSAEWKRDFAVLGSACGVAAAFLAPMGGVLFAIEEGATVWRQQLTFFALYGACLTSFIVGCVQGSVFHPGYSPVVPEVVYGSYQDVASSITFRAKDFPFVLLTGVIGGLFGASFSAIQKKVSRWRRDYVRISKYRTLIEVVIVSLLVSTARFWLPQIFHRCVDDHEFEEAQGHAVPLWTGAPSPNPFDCPDGEVNGLGALTWVSQDAAIKYLFHGEGTYLISTGELFVALGFYYLFTVLVFGIAVPSGLFIPSLAIGAIYGRLVGQLNAWSTGSAALVTSYAFLGGASALGGMTRVTISVALIALETTQNFTASLYCYSVVLIAKLVADSINIGIYDLIIETMTIPFLVDDLGYEGYQLTMEDVMHPVDLESATHAKVVIDTGVEEPRNTDSMKLPSISIPNTGSPVPTTAGVMNRSRMRTNSTSHLYDQVHQEQEKFSMPTILGLETLGNVMNLMHKNPKVTEFLALTETGGLLGIVERLVIFRILENGLFGEDAPLLHPSTIDAAWPNLRNKVANELPLFKELARTQNLEKTLVDLRPYVDLEPPIVLTTSCLRKAHFFLRNGERNVLVAHPESIKIAGVVTRHDLMPGMLSAVSKAKEEYDFDSGLHDDNKPTADDVKKFDEPKKLSPFEPRFYELMAAYFRAHKAKQSHDSSHSTTISDGIITHSSPGKSYQMMSNNLHKYKDLSHGQK